MSQVKTFMSSTITLLFHNEEVRFDYTSLDIENNNIGADTVHHIIVHMMEHSKSDTIFGIPIVNINEYIHHQFEGDDKIYTIPALDPSIPNRPNDTFECIKYYIPFKHMETLTRYHVTKDMLRKLSFGEQLLVHTNEKVNKKFNSSIDELTKTYMENLNTITVYNPIEQCNHVEHCFDCPYNDNCHMYAASNQNFILNAEKIASSIEDDEIRTLGD